MNAPLAKTFPLIAETKGEAFYKGKLATDICDFAAQHGAALSREDMAAHSPEWCGTISQSFDSLEFHQIPPTVKASPRLWP